MNTINSIDYSELEATEQGTNPVETGLCTPEEAQFLLKAACSWDERDRLDAVLLRALCQLTINRSGTADDGFTSQELAVEMSSILNRTWPPGGNDDVADTTKPVGDQWKKLQKLWHQKSRGLEDSAADNSITAIPFPEKRAGGGTGHYTRHFLRLKSIENQIPLRSGQTPVSDQVSVSYICEDLTDAGLLARGISNGWHMVGWRRWTTLGVLISAITVCAFLVLLMALSLRSAIPFQQTLQVIIFGGIIIGAIWLSLAPVFTLPERRVNLAPWWIQSPFNDRLLVWQSPPAYSTKAITAARYTAECPICGDKIIVKSGKLEFWGRLVGRCESAPNAHVFSFDHVTRRGSHLRLR